MFHWQFTFLSPAYLLLLAVVPLCWWWSFGRLAVLGSVRRLSALGLRTLVLVLFVLAMADMQLQQISNRLTVIYLLDQSLSIPPERRGEMIVYVNAAVRRHRQHDDRVGVIVFGRDAAIEIPPFDDDVQLPPAIESLLDPEYTNIAAAMKLAQASFPEDAARRIVVISDGNQNLGDAATQARELAAAGIGIDVMPVRYARRAEVAVERVVLPSDIRRGQPFELKVVLSNTAQATATDAGEVPGRLILSRITGGETRVLNRDEDQHVVLKPGKSVFPVRQQIDAPDFYTYEARFIPDRPEDDTMPQNNRATAFTHVRGRGQVLIVASPHNRGEYEVLAARLRLQNREVTVRTSDQAFADLAELQPFDTVVLANVPREDFSDTQIEALVRNTQQLGAGLVMLGGENSFGAGGWMGTPLEEALPVDFQVKATKVVARGALAMLMHASEIPEGNYWQKVIAREALKSLGPRDYCGVLHWSGNEQWLWRPGLRSIDDEEIRRRMLGAIDRLTPGDMPDFQPSVALAAKAFASLSDAAVKHMIIISDGDPAAPNSSTVQAMVNQKVTISTVAVGAHGPAESNTLRQIALQGGGKYYQVANPKLLPKIYQREARRVARPLVYENTNGLVPRIQAEHADHEMIRGLVPPLLPITGLVLTGKKSSSLVETVLTSPEPADEEANTLLAGWTYGLGRAVAFTSDAAPRWMAGWVRGENFQAYDKLMGQIIGWSMRPVADTGKFNIATEVADGRVRVVVSALDKNDQFLNFLNMAATAVGPDLKPVPLELEQTAPGRYVGSLPAQNAGSYFLTIAPGAGQAPLSTGVTVPYSDEFRDRSTNEDLLAQLAALTPPGASRGQLLPPLDGETKLETLLSADPFRHDLPNATSSQTIWHYLVLAAACLFFGDVLVRRVHIHFAWVLPLLGRLRDFVLRRGPAPIQAEYFDRLRSRKEEVGQQIEQIRSTARFEAPAGESGKLEEESGKRKAESGEEKQAELAPQAEEESYTARLLKAKKKVWDKKDEPK
jgi:uncharacterized membrane protein